MITVFDIDNCIANDQWRHKYIASENPDVWERFENYHLMAAYDEPVNLNVVQKIPAENRVFFTAMPEYYAPLRRAWLMMHNIDYFKIYFRRDEDHRHSVDVKRDMLYKLMFDCGARSVEDLLIDAIYDDRPSIIKMFKEDFELPAIRMYVHDSYKSFD